MIKPEASVVRNTGGLWPFVRVPAAGRLGVIEERCSGPHAEELVLIEELLPCVHCGAAV